MDAAWEDLRRAGVPLGAARPCPTAPPEPIAIRRALATLADARDAIAVPDREPLLAWLRAVLRHWPSRAAEVTGPSGDQLRAWLETQPIDRGRYLKLRRIAIANLAGWL